MKYPAVPDAGSSRPHPQTVIRLQYGVNSPVGVNFALKSIHGLKFFRLANSVLTLDGYQPNHQVLHFFDCLNIIFLHVLQLHELIHNFPDEFFILGFPKKLEAAKNVQFIVMKKESERSSTFWIMRQGGI